MQSQDPVCQVHCCVRSFWCLADTWRTFSERLKLSFDLLESFTCLIQISLYTGPWVSLSFCFSFSLPSPSHWLPLTDDRLMTHNLQSSQPGELSWHGQGHASLGPGFVYKLESLWSFSVLPHFSTARQGPIAVLALFVLIYIWQGNLFLWFNLSLLIYETISRLKGIFITFFSL